MDEHDGNLASFQSTQVLPPDTIRNPRFFVICKLQKIDEKMLSRMKSISLPAGSSEQQ